VLRRFALIGVATLVLIGLSTGRARATEKYWAAHEADLIVVGTLRPMHAYPWFDGWHTGGTIAIHETLYGTAPGTALEFRDVLRWSPPGMHLDWRYLLAHPTFYPEFMTGEGLWFLKRVDQRFWQPSGFSGFDSLSRRADYEDYIRRSKR
jgi:hypothetical protein